MAEFIVVGRVELVESAGVRGVRRIRRARRIFVLGFDIERLVRYRPAAAEGGVPGVRVQIRGAHLPLLQGRLQTVFDPVRDRSRQTEAKRVKPELVRAILAGTAGES